MNILTYHVYAGAVEVPSDRRDDGHDVPNGDDATFTVTDGTVKIGDATVTTADVPSSNGVIHVIDKVLTPPADPVGDICYNTITHTIVPGADLQTCTSYSYYENYTMMGQTVTGCYNMATHQLSNVTKEVCDAYAWVPQLTYRATAGATTIHTALVAA